MSTVGVALVVALLLSACGTAGSGRVHESPATQGPAAAVESAPPAQSAPAAQPSAEAAAAERIDVSVRVLTPEGDPVVGQPVSAENPRDRGSIMGTPFAKGETNEFGIAVLRDLDPARPCDLKIHRFVMHAQDLGGHYVSDWLPRNLDVVLTRYYAARGRVVDREGHAIVGAVVLRTDCDDEYRRDSGPDGRFEFEGLLRGHIAHVRAMPSESYGVPGRSVPIVAGGEEVLIEIDRGADFVLTIRNWPTRQEAPGYRGRAHMTSLGRPPMRHYASVSNDGRVTFQGVSADATYALWVPNVGNPPRHYYRSGLRADDGPLEVDLVPGETVRVRVRTTNTYRRLASVEGPGFDITGRTRVEDEDPDAETIVISGVPPGEWDVVAKSGGTKSHLENEKRVRARTGTSLEIKLPEPPER